MSQRTQEKERMVGQLQSVRSSCCQQHCYMTCEAKEQLTNGQYACVSVVQDITASNCPGIKTFALKEVCIRSKGKNSSRNSSTGMGPTKYFFISEPISDISFSR